MYIDIDIERVCVCVLSSNTSLPSTASRYSLSLFSLLSLSLFWKVVICCEVVYTANNEVSPLPPPFPPVDLHLSATQKQKGGGREKQT